MIKCPKCGEELEANFNRYQNKEADYTEVEFTCKNDHMYFVRVKEDDIIEC